jgi:pantetheine-phosphate adenylyltransferase
MRLALFPGTFDPFTLGHLDILERALQIFDEVEVIVAVNTAKKNLLSEAERCDVIRASAAHLAGVSVVRFEGLIAEYARQRGATALVRGLRQSSDFEYERPMAIANRQLLTGLETVFLIPSEAHSFVSSTIVRDIHRWGGDVSAFVPEPVFQVLQAKRITD